MKLKRINKIRIGSTDFQVIWDKTRDGGEFSYRNKKLVIGTNHRTTVEILDTIIHELKEMIHIEQWTRFDDGSSSGQYIFVYNHDRHDELCSRLAGLLEQFIV